MPLIPGAEAMDFTGVIAQIVYYTGLALFTLFIFGVGAALLYVMPFKYKVDVFPLYGSGKDGHYTIGKRKRNRVKWNKGKTAWIKLWPFMNNKELRPMDNAFIYPGNQLYVYEIGEEWVPGKLNVKVDAKEIPKKEAVDMEKDILQYINAVYPHLKQKPRIIWNKPQTWFHRKDMTAIVPIDIKVQAKENIVVELNPVPLEIRKWQSLQHKKNAQEFAMEGFWEENKHFIMTIATVIACLACVGVTAYLIIKYSSGAASNTKMLTAAIRDLSSSVGGTPPG